MEADAERQRLSTSLYPRFSTSEAGIRMLSHAVLRYVNNGLLRRFQAPCLLKALSTSAPLGNGWQSNASHSGSTDDWERIFDGLSRTDSTSDSFYRRLDRAERYAKLNGMNYADEELNGPDEGSDTLSDGMDEELEEAASFFEVDEEEFDKEDYSFRPDMNFRQGDTYELRDLDLTKPGWYKPNVEDEFVVSTEEVLSNADFRNVRFLANFVTEAGIIIKRNKTEISAKAQRKVAREIKTARAFGLMPFTTMGTKSFVFGTNMENKDEDFQYERFSAQRDNESEEDSF